MTTKELIYEALNGQLSEASEFVSESGMVIRNEFAKNKRCDMLYEEVYNAKQSLCERLNEEENPEAEQIVANMEVIMRTVAMKMFDYGFECAKMNTMDIHKAS
ncbi:MAG: hypothetical protein IJW18_05290 [Lachnospiraceae bacterium]|nr:hypothetical protein [Lachnospiraceae bacterium]